MSRNEGGSQTTVAGKIPIRDESAPFTERKCKGLAGERGS